MERNMFKWIHTRADVFVNIIIDYFSIDYYSYYFFTFQGNIKPCIRLCCPFGTFVDSSIQGKKCREHEAAKEFESDIVDANNNANKMVLDYHFAFVDDRPCGKFYLAETYNITHVSCFQSN